MTKTLNGVPFRQVMVPASKYGIKAPYSMVPKKVTLHETDNQMAAINEINYMISNNNQTSFHFAADETEIIQGIPTNRNSWNAGDGGNGYGNRNTISVEICRNYDRTRLTTQLLEPLSSQYQKAVENAIKAIPQIMIDNNIVANIDNIRTHNDWSGKWCPRKILNDGTLAIVKAGIINEYNRLTGKEVPKQETVKHSSKVDSHLSLAQVIDKTIAGGYGNQPQREKNIVAKTNFTYKQVQDGVDAKQKANKQTITVKPKETNSIAGAKFIKNEKGKYTVTVKDGIKVRNNPTTSATHTRTLKQGQSINYDQVYEGNGYRWLAYDSNNGRRYLPYRPINGTSEQWGTFGSQTTNVATKPATTKAKTLYLPKSATSWRIYKQNGPYTVGNEVGKLAPSKFGGLSYEIKGEKGNGVYLIDTKDFGRVAIYAGKDTSATIK